MKMKVIATLIMSLAFAAQAGEARWGNDTDKGDMSQEILSTTVNLFTPDSVNGAMSALYKVTFAPFIGSLVGNAQYTVLSSSDAIENDSYVDIPSPVHRISNIVGYRIKPPSLEGLEEEKWKKMIVPEPNAMVLLALGGMALLLRRKRAKE